MATSVCNVAKFSMGNIQCHVFSVTVGAVTTMEFDTGLRSIEFHQWAPASCTCMGDIHCIKNQASQGTAKAGFIRIASGTAGDDLTVFAWGK